MSRPRHWSAVETGKMTKYIVGNWKMNGDAATLAAMAEAMLSADGVETVICPPFIWLAEAARVFAGKGIALGAQNVGDVAAGARTGEVSAAMLRACGCTYVIVGHSERRTHYNDTDARVLERCRQALEQGLRPLLCVGETLAERDRGQAEQVVLCQLDAVFASGEDLAGLDSALVAYEPVWAIGGGGSASVEDVSLMHGALRRRLRELSLTAVPILYGGSLSPDNADELLSLADVDGGLVGGASLRADALAALVTSAARRL